MKFKHLIFFILVTLFTQGAFAAEGNLKEIFSNKSSPVEVIFKTTMGSFTLELNPGKAPKTVANFLTYVDEGFYNNTLFHRVIPRFMVQGGGFEKGMNQKKTHSPVINESHNGLRNLRGTISMARTRSPDSATSQFFINVQQNITLDHTGTRPGYTVFGKITDGMKVIDKIVKVPTKKSGSYSDVPKEDVVILSTKRKGLVAAQGSDKKEQFIAGEHYIVLDSPVPVRDSSKIEVLELFSYGCTHCYEFEPLIKAWSKQQADDVDFWYSPAAWNESMSFYAQAFYTFQELNAEEKIHLPLFTAVLIEQKKLGTEKDLAKFFAEYDIDNEAFAKAFNSTAVDNQVKQAEARSSSYKLAGVPEIIVNGKYRVDRARAGGQAQMLAVVDFLVKKERASLKK